MTTVMMEIGGMRCGHCVGAVASALKDLAGVEVEQVTVGQVVVRYDPGAVSPARIAQVIEDEGYAVVGSR